LNFLDATRARTDLYRFEMSDAQHLALLDTIKRLPCMVLISGYWSALYADSLTTWRSVSFQAVTRSGRTATEWVWCNFPEPVALHDYRYLGKDFRERERIKRKKQRWVKRLQSLTILERQAMLAAIEEVWL
jgi:DNA adenine methylase